MTKTRFMTTMMEMLVVWMALAWAGTAYAGNVTINWEGPIECADGSALTNCPTTGYYIFMGTSETGTGYGQRAEAPAATATSITLVNVPAGDRCFYMKTRSNASVSGESNRVCANVPAPGPKSPRITTVVVISPP